MLSVLTSRFRLLLQQLLLVLVLQQFINNPNHHVVVDAALSCSEDSFCEQMIRPGSYCIIEQDDNDGTTSTIGVCSNPFAKGCLKTLLPEKLKSSDEDVEELRRRIEGFYTILEGRICNSDDIDNNNDEDDNNDRTQCKNPLFEYSEIRIHNSNWESSIFLSWIFQIVLMEILEVPVTIGLGPSGVGHGSGIQDNTYDASFYNPYNTFSYSSVAYPWEALKMARQIGDCNRVHEIMEDDDSTQTTTATVPPCAHVLPEVWNGQAKESSDALREGYIDPIEGNGQVGKSGWFIPDYTASEYDSSLVSFYGIRGEENRRKLAAAYKRPLAWRDYCETISASNCTAPDTVAKHYPTSESEQTSYFAGSSYTGYFHLSDKNNCTKNPMTCTGVLIAPPCTWSGAVDSQLYWNDLVGLEPDGPLEPNGGYSYSSMIEIWRAANATKSNVIMWWWKPEALVEEFYGTSYEFIPFDLPIPSDVCANSRVDTAGRCSSDINERRGLQAGACDQEVHPLTKVYATSLRELTFEDTNSAYRSPGYETIRNIKIPYLHMKDILEGWIQVGTDKYGYDPREAVCSWVVNNLDDLLDSIPDGYPRILTEEHSLYHDGYKYAAIVVACIINLIVWMSLGATYYYRDTRVIKFAQREFLQSILVGYCLISIAAIVIVLQPPTNLRCNITVWLVALGYTIELVPLLVKIAAINKIMQSAQKMRRVQISKKIIAQTVIGVVLVVVIYLIVWTIIDPLKVTEIRTLTTRGTDGGDVNDMTIDRTPFVLSNIKCDCSYYTIWSFIVISEQGILILMASVLAYQSRKVRQEFNESRTLGTMAYSHFMFLLLRIIVFVVDDFYNRSSTTSGGRIFPATIMVTVLSFLYSFDTLAALCIYIIPKIRKAVESSTDNKRFGTSRTTCTTAASGVSAISEIQRNAANEESQYSAISEIQRNAAKEESQYSSILEIQRNAAKEQALYQEKSNNDSNNNHGSFNLHDSCDYESNIHGISTINGIPAEIKSGIPKPNDTVNEHDDDGEKENDVADSNCINLRMVDDDQNEDEGSDDDYVEEANKEMGILQDKLQCEKEAILREVSEDGNVDCEEENLVNETNEEFDSGSDETDKTSPTLAETIVKVVDNTNDIDQMGTQRPSESPVPATTQRLSSGFDNLNSHDEDNGNSQESRTTGIKLGKGEKESSNSHPLELELGPEAQSMSSQSTNISLPLEGNDHHRQRDDMGGSQASELSTSSRLSDARLRKRRSEEIFRRSITDAEIP